MTVETVVYDEHGHGARDDPVDARDDAGTTWVRVVDPTDAELDEIAAGYGLHALEIEDVLGDVRPKVEEFDEHTLVLVKAATLRRGDVAFADELRDEPVGFFVGDDWLVTIEPDRVAALDAVWDRVAREEPRLLSHGPDFAAYRGIDRVVDDYYAILDDIEDDIEAVEDEVVDPAGEDVLERINSLRRDLLSVRRLLWPTRDAVGVLARGDPVHVDVATEKYFRDVYDHLVQLVDLTETYRDLTSSARDIYLNALSMSTNEVMKTLTVVATILLPLTFVVGVYGMNFQDSALNMPELGWQYGYPAVMLGMALTAGILVAYFRRENWL
ncbi:magnesium/cobalt transporter CorA [Halobacterium litoreum]|uniref:Magnesium transport protein CorA n=1 Tax=Halobacterium litoreum TaxID=2039234 RepID=A0ABD5NFR4_9EURY|nr:magnesium/cobalt transporter CorA [Halobacterium litoreum]UHH13078.1 magnesium/cobalt transporter CorA [Halobacterium litoreum]